MGIKAKETGRREKPESKGSLLVERLISIGVIENMVKFWTKVLFLWTFESY